MKRFFMLATLYATVSTYAHSQVVISQIYGGGGNAGAPYKRDFIELFNQGTAPVTISNYSIQYLPTSSSTGTAWTTFEIPINKTIPAKGYFLIHCAAGNGGNGTDLPSADAVCTISLSATEGQIALLTSSSALTSCPNSSAVVDLVGFSMDATCFLGTKAISPSNTMSLLRKGFGTINTKVNADDFVRAEPNPRNSAIILPLQLLSFSAAPKDNTVAFSWKTVNERNTHHFEIEQSFDGTNFKPIATIPAGGTTTTETSYGHTGKQNTAVTYYRLRMVDADARSTTSAVVKIAPSRSGFSLGNVYPIPAKNSLTIEWNSRNTTPTTLTLTDVSGKLLRTQTLPTDQGSNRYLLDVSTLRAGQYLLQLTSGIDRVQTMITK